MDIELRSNVIRTFTEETVDLPEIVDMELDDASYVYDQGLAVQEIGQLVQGYAAACYQKQYGGQGIKRFAVKVDDSRQAVADHARVYKRLMNLNDDERLVIMRGLKNRKLRYTHLLMAQPIEDDFDYGLLLEAAADKQWNTTVFKEKLTDWRMAETEEARQKALEEKEEEEEEEKSGDDAPKEEEEEDTAQTTIDEQIELATQEEEEEEEEEEETSRTVGEALTQAQEEGAILDLPPKHMSESQEQGYKSVERYMLLTKYDPEEVAKAHDKSKDPEGWRQEVERTNKVIDWLDRYLAALTDMQ